MGKPQKAKHMKRPRGWHRTVRQDNLFRRASRQLDEAWAQAAVHEHPDAVVDKRGRLVG